MLNEAELRSGLEALSDLSIDEYHQNLAEILAEDDPLPRLGRLVGVIIKQPMATERTLDIPSPRSRAYRAWDLKSSTDFEIASQSGTWQFELWRQLRQDLSTDDSLVATLDDFGFAGFAETESGFFGLFARNLRKYICADPKIRKAVDDAFKRAAGALGAKKAPTPEMVVASGGLTLGAYLVGAVPLLGLAGAPAVAGIVLILYVLGTRAFCERFDVTKTDDVERH